MGAYSKLGDYISYPKGVRGRKCVFNPKSKNMSCLLQCLELYQILEDHPIMVKKCDCELQYILEEGNHNRWFNLGRL